MLIIKNKKAISNIIAVIMIILLSIIAISLLFSYTKKLSDSSLSTLSPTIDCIKLNTKAVSCFNNLNQEIETTITPNPGEYINYLKFSVSSIEDSFTFGCGTSNEFSCDERCIAPGNNKMKYFIPATIDSKISITLDKCVNFPITKTNIPLC